MLKKFLNPTSKTFWGLLLGILGILLESTGYVTFLPEIVAKLVLVIGGLITAMGLRDAMLESQVSIVAKIIDFKSKTFWGVFIEAVVHLTMAPEQLPVPEWLKTTLKIIGALAITMGLRDAAKKGIVRVRMENETAKK